LTVRSPLIATSATFALMSAPCCRRCAISFSFVSL
jgi:hypothetical protein